MANSSICSVCVKAAEQGVNPTTTDKSKRAWADQLGVSEASVRRHFKHGPIPKLPDTVAPASASTQNQATVEESSTGARSITAIRDRPITLEDAREWIESTGDNPEDYTLSIKSIAYGGNLFSNKMSAVPKRRPATVTTEPALTDAEIDALVSSATPEIDPIEILKEIRSLNGSDEVSWGEEVQGNSAFVLSFNDTQFGKAEGGGTPATLARIDKFVSKARERILELRKIGRSLGTLVIIGGGDIVEGCVIYPNQSFMIDLDRRGQINTAVTSILDVIDRLAPLFSRVVVLAARGNHGENRIAGNRTTLYDNDDTLVFEMAKQATDRDPSLAHVEYIIAQSEAGVYADVAGWRLATTHGDVYGKTAGPIDKRAQGWYKNMAMARNPLGLADVLITHHFHHDRGADWGSCFWRQTPALDGGSQWFEQTTGEYSEAGMLTFVMGPDSRYQDEQVLR